MREEGYVLNGKEKRMTGERRGRRERGEGGRQRCLLPKVLSYHICHCIH